MLEKLGIFWKMNTQRLNAFLNSKKLDGTPDPKAEEVFVKVFDDLDALRADYIALEARVKVLESQMPIALAS
jgi:hypothetical protein